jgi:hypothetical protein
MQQAKENMENKYKEDLQNRLGECSIVINDLVSTDAWKILLSDMGKQKQNIDDCWQNTPADKIESLKALKMGVMHVISVPEAYAAEKAHIQNELAKIDNPEVIEKDYDGE